MANSRDLLEVADELYAAPIDAFTSTRNARAAAARKGGERELAASIAALRKPSMAAWACNLLSRRSGRAIDDLAALREELSTATARGDREALRRLSSTRHRTIDDLVREAAELAETAGKPLSAAALDEVSEALLAALGDVDIGRALATGRLVAAPGTGGASRAEIADLLAVPPDELLAPLDDEEPDDDADTVDTPATAAKRFGRGGGRGATTKRNRSSGRDAGPTGRAGPSSAERRRHERDLAAASERAAAAAADRAAREHERDEAVRRRDDLAAEVRRQRDALRALERRLDDADDDVDARTADIRGRELDWKRAEAAERVARRLVEQDRETADETR